MRLSLIALFTLAASTPSLVAAQDSRFPEPVPPAMEGVIEAGSNLPDRFTPRPEADPVAFGERVCPVEYEDDKAGTVLRLVRSVSSKITNVQNDRRVTEEVSYGDYWIAGENPYGVTLGRDADRLRHGQGHWHRSSLQMKP